MPAGSRRQSPPARAGAPPPAEGWQGWDTYADFYDWENARTLDRRDIAFWQDLARRSPGPVLELGCGTGRVSIPVARTGAHLVGIDRSEEMLAHARRRGKRARPKGTNAVGRLSWIRGDIRALPFPDTAGF